MSSGQCLRRRRLKSERDAGRVVVVVVVVVMMMDVVVVSAEHSQETEREPCGRDGRDGKKTRGSIEPNLMGSKVNMNFAPSARTLCLHLHLHLHQRLHQRLHLCLHLCLGLCLRMQQGWDATYLRYPRNEGDEGSEKQCICPGGSVIRARPPSVPVLTTYLSHACLLGKYNIPLHSVQHSLGMYTLQLSLTVEVRSTSHESSFHLRHCHIRKYPASPKARRLPWAPASRATAAPSLHANIRTPP